MLIRTYVELRIVNNIASEAVNFVTRKQQTSDAFLPKLGPSTSQSVTCLAHPSQHATPVLKDSRKPPTNLPSVNTGTEQLILSFSAPIQALAHHFKDDSILSYKSVLTTAATALHNLSKASFRDTKAHTHSLLILLARSYTCPFSHVLCSQEFLCLHRFVRMLPLLLFLKQKQRGRAC